MKRPSAVGIARLVVMLALGLSVTAAGARAATHSATRARISAHPAAAAVHTAAHARHHAHRRHAHRSHAHYLIATRSTGGHVPPPAPALPRAPERKATLPTTVHAQRHSPGSTHKQRHALAPALTPVALSVAGGAVPLDRSMVEPVPASILRPGRAPPRAGPSTDPAASPQFPRGHSFPPAVFDPSIRSERSSTVLPFGATGATVCALTLPYPPTLKPELPSGRSRADRLEGAAAWQTMPSS